MTIDLDKLEALVKAVRQEQAANMQTPPGREDLRELWAERYSKWYWDPDLYDITTKGGELLGALSLDAIDELVRLARVGEDLESMRQALFPVAEACAAVVSIAPLLPSRQKAVHYALTGVTQTLRDPDFAKVNASNLESVTRELIGMLPAGTVATNKAKPSTPG